jgi:hypothetical protein
MKRTGFARKAKPLAGLLRTANLGQSAMQMPAAPKRAASKPRSRPKQTKIRASARGQECTLRFPYTCNFRTDTTVLCHSNQLKDGKGMGLKAPDTRAAYGCSDCHDVLDGRRPRPNGLTHENMLERFEEAVRLTHTILARKDLLKESE